MAVLVTMETCVLVLLVVLVAGLLRSHADILRALHSLGAHVGDPAVPGDGAAPGGPAASGGRAVPGPGAAVPVPVPGPDRRAGVLADLVGVTLDGEAVGIGMSGPGTDTLVAFLSSGCGTCATFWHALEGGGHDDLAPARVVVVTRDPAEERPAALGRLDLGDVAVVMSSPAWDDYAVPGSPYFVYVDGQLGRVTGEGTATGWDQLVSLCTDARADDRAGRDARVDRELLAAGIHPGHPSLYPPPTAGRPGPTSP